ncbi:O-methyltransferase [Acanthamoeba castellanii str. Neff]|uniref:O-methyltransferase n=1 Tax=Acanthamoeba castellanii (strain ATCC 30010 / Neff) TaxID=1257118 RepID=L8GSP8_ACACF|nr:O-methyltransferase [Acanthamoeba castellanii str. Neff]ELR16229.1 O-methyltransferase [Acanthamoeba castellanii str. Neff]
MQRCRALATGGVARRTGGRGERRGGALRQRAISACHRHHFASASAALPEREIGLAPAEATTKEEKQKSPYSRKACVGSLDSVVYDYVVDVGVKESPVQRACREHTSAMREGHLQISPDQGAFLGWLVRALGVRKAVEVGVFTGYSSLCIVEAMKSDGRLYACELSEDYARTASAYWREAGVDDRVDLRLGAAIESMERLLAEHGASFDFAFIDADKRNYGIYYELALKLLRPGGTIARSPT